MNPIDFSPALLRLQDSPPNPLGRKILWTLLALLAALILWALLGQLDIVAVATGKLVPESYVKIVQPAEAGIVKEILVKEGEFVRSGQVLMRMDTLISEADASSLAADFQRKQMALRRIDAELSGQPLKSEAQTSRVLAREIDAQYAANRAALEANLAEERARLLKARHEFTAAEEIKKKLAESLPYYRGQERAFAELLQGKFVAPSEAGEKRRELLEKEQELRTQEAIIESARASIQQSEKKLVQIESEYRRQLYAERNETQSQVDKLAQERTKQSYRRELMELKASQDSIVKDLATHSVGTVVQPGTVLLTLVPRAETLRAEVWVANGDVGFVRPGQQVKLKFAAFPFQKYGMLDGTVAYVSADAADNAPVEGGGLPAAARQGQPLAYRALVALQTKQLEVDGEGFLLTAGMQTSAEIHLGERRVFEYLLSPVRRAWHEAGRER